MDLESEIKRLLLLLLLLLLFVNDGVVHLVGGWVFIS